MKELFESEGYKELIKKNNFNAIELLLKENSDFAIAAYTDFINFTPPIPEDIIKLDKLVLFVISGYTKESANLNENSFNFEAGFGETNFGSHLEIPIEAIAQVVVGENIVTLSHYKPKEKAPKSMDVLLNNPENQALLKRLQKEKNGKK